MEKLACSISEAAESISVTKATIYALIKQGKIKTVRLGRRQLVRVDSLRNLIGLDAQCTDGSMKPMTLADYYADIGRGLGQQIAEQREDEDSVMVARSVVKEFLCKHFTEEQAAAIWGTILRESQQTDDGHPEAEGQ